MTTLNRTFRLDGDEIHAVVLRQSSKRLWNAFLWGGGLRLANTFARREAAEKWLRTLLLRHFPGVQREIADS